jgi:hypothetical protein
MKNELVPTKAQSLISPLLAHNIQTSGEVGALFHLEPNHNPKAGEPATVWFALTRKGGTPIRLTDCNCQLQVLQNDQIVAQPTLQAIDAEQNRGVPSAIVTFPQAGLYQLVIRGQPKTEALFPPFQFTYPVTVQPGASPAAPASPAPTPMAESTWDLAWAAIAGMAIVALVILIRTKQRK